eukprot:364311-Chlamydomonas_euryale.AAC.10
MCSSAVDVPGNSGWNCMQRQLPGSSHISQLAVSEVERKHAHVGGQGATAMQVGGWKGERDL